MRACERCSEAAPQRGCSGAAVVQGISQRVVNAVLHPTHGLSRLVQAAVAAAAQLPPAPNHGGRGASGLVQLAPAARRACRQRACELWLAGSGGLALFETRVASFSAVAVQRPT